MTKSRGSGGAPDIAGLREGFNDLKKMPHWLPRVLALEPMLEYAASVEQATEESKTRLEFARREEALFATTRANELARHEAIFSAAKQQAEEELGRIHEQARESVRNIERLRVEAEADLVAMRKNGESLIVQAKNDARIIRADAEGALMAANDRVTRLFEETRIANDDAILKARAAVQAEADKLRELETRVENQQGRLDAINAQLKAVRNQINQIG